MDVHTSSTLLGHRFVSPCALAAVAIDSHCSTMSSASHNTSPLRKHVLSPHAPGQGRFTCIQQSASKKQM